MRIYGRDQNSKWVEFQTDPNGFNDYVYAINLIQVLKLNLGESPFYGNWGIPAAQSVIQQIAPDYYTILTQQRFAPRFANLTVIRITTYTSKNVPIPTYRVNILTNQGVQLVDEVPT